MRPRVFPAEDSEDDAGHQGRIQASMRPRVFPAEDFRDDSQVMTGGWCFNEAAGIPRGRRSDGTTDIIQTNYASMRPRVFPAEDRPCIAV